MKNAIIDDDRLLRRHRGWPKHMRRSNGQDKSVSFFRGDPIFADIMESPPFGDVIDFEEVMAVLRRFE